MNDKAVVILCIAGGLAVAFVASSPLRNQKMNAPRVGTPLRQEMKQPPPSGGGQVYAQGTISISPTLQSKAEQSTLFLIIRGPSAGAPIAVQRLAHAHFPLEFMLTEANNMAGEGFYDGDVTFIARLDQDGQAGPVQAGDVEAKLELKKGASRTVQLELR